MEAVEMQTNIEETVNKIKELDSEGRIDFIVLYGSLSRNRDNPLSDIDIAIHYDGDKKERFRFRINVQGRLSNRFDIQIFQDLPLYIRNEVIKHGKPLYYRDYKGISNTYLQTLREYEDFEKYLRLYYSYLKKDAKHGR
ncbi:MAG: nucleotidyltransferase domain-containing protein [Candidatus Altiarchaeota archaeon]|nr:nucleotidyltransferase domain-containing protein [Candidatus Altiarchaeota archaeon]